MIPEPATYRVAAVDPGDAWCGLSEFELAPQGGRLTGSGFVDQSAQGKIRLIRCRTLRPDHLYAELEKIAPYLYGLVLERYSLYPWMAREQGFSEMFTAQCAGVVTDIAVRRFRLQAFEKQDAKGTLRDGRAYAKKHGFKMRDRVLGSGQWKYRGPDFDLPGKPHRRDASSHGVYWAVRSALSPLR